MACKSPIYAYQHKTGGKLIFNYNPFTDSDYVPVTIPCGQCIECRKQKAREWANRILMESKYHDSNYCCSACKFCHYVWSRYELQSKSL
jgi:MinD superfamily P-loop ATPase